MNKQAFPIQHFYPSHPRTVFPIRGQEVDDRADLVQEEPPDLQCWTMILATCVVVDVSRCLETLTWEVSAMLERRQF